MKKETHTWGCLFFLVFTVLYALTAQRGVSWQDSGEFQYRVVAGDFVWNSGIARAHPLYILGAKLFAACFPSSLTLYAVTLFSGLGMAAALALLAMLLWRLTVNRWATAVAVVTLGLSQMCWWMSTVAEVYTWSLAFLMAELLCLLNVCDAPKAKAVRWWLALAFVNGLHASLHNVALLNLPVYGVLFVVMCLTQRQGCRRYYAVLACALAWLAGAALLVWLFCVELKTHTLGATLRSLLFGYGYDGVVLGAGRVNGRLAFFNLALAGVSLASPCWLFVVRGMKASCAQAAFKRCLLALTCIHFVFWIRYFVPDQATFVLPTLGLLAVWLGLGCAITPLKAKTLCVCLAVGAACQIAAPPLLCRVASRCGIAQTRTLPFRQDIPYWLLPWKHHETSAQQFVDETGKMLHDGDVLFADSTSAGPLMAVRVAQASPCAWPLISPWTGETEAALLALTRQQGGRVFVVSPVRGYAPAALLETKRFEREGILYRVLENE